MLPLNRMMRCSKMAVSAEALMRKSYVRPVQHSLPLLARLGPPGTSAFPPLVGAKRTSVGECELSRFMSTRPN
jgi:hypothetical protein